ncbi:GntR family transcriptional regulator [Roseibium sp.]|uniref:GntR family transcriptional regulator n=1 Tax=Roseibium sp. TaxID=1936156 RepID=UPI0039F00081
MRLQLDKGKASGGTSAPNGKRPRKSAAVFQDLKQKILTGHLTSDSPITEQSLAKDYECSQSTIREALMQLQEHGLVIRRGYKGTYVTDPSLLEARLMLKLRLDIELTGVSEAAEKITSRELQQLREIDDLFEACRSRRDVFGCAESDQAFHRKLFGVANMPALEPMLVRSILGLQRVMLSTPRPDSAWARPNVTPHRAILDALVSGARQGAADALKAHILSSAILLAPHFYGHDVDELQEEFEKKPVLRPALAGL